MKDLTLEYHVQNLWTIDKKGAMIGSILQSNWLQRNIFCETKDVLATRQSGKFPRYVPMKQWRDFNAHSWGQIDFSRRESGGRYKPLYRVITCSDLSCRALDTFSNAALPLCPIFYKAGGSSNQLNCEDLMPPVVKIVIRLDWNLWACPLPQISERLLRSMHVVCLGQTKVL